QKYTGGPSGRARSRVANSYATRVLPIPAGPVTVTTRAPSAKAAPIAARARSRPTNVLPYSRSPPRGPAPGEGGGEPLWRVARGLASMRTECTLQRAPEATRARSDAIDSCRIAWWLGVAPMRPRQPLPTSDAGRTPAAIALVRAGP